MSAEFKPLQGAARLQHEGREWVPAEEMAAAIEALHKAEKLAERWFRAAMTPTAAQETRLEEWRSWGQPVDAHPLWEVPDGSLLVYRWTKDGSGVGQVGILEPEPTGRFVIDMGVD